MGAAKTIVITGATDGLGKGLALDLAAAGITVNVVAPGWFDSPLAKGWMADPDLAAGITGHTALGRWGASTDLAGAYQFLASEASAFVTGSVLSVDGGRALLDPLYASRP